MIQSRVITILVFFTQTNGIQSLPEKRFHVEEHTPVSRGKDDNEVHHIPMYSPSESKESEIEQENEPERRYPLRNRRKRNIEGTIK